MGQGEQVPAKSDIAAHSYVPRAQQKSARHWTIGFLASYAKKILLSRMGSRHIATEVFFNISVLVPIELDGGPALVCLPNGATPPGSEASVQCSR